jgi:hypothetical protein
VRFLGNFVKNVGNITQPNGPSLENKNSKIYLLDIRNYTWVYKFEPSSPLNTTSPIPSNPSTSTNTNTPESNNQLTTTKVVIGTLSGIFGTVILMTVGFFGYRWYQMRQLDNQDEVLRVYGNAT